MAACIDDLSRRQISNWIPCSAFAGGVILQTVQHGLRGAGSALAGTCAGAAVFLVFYLLGGMGGGDVKLMAGFGALLGVKQLLASGLVDGGLRRVAGCGGHRGSSDTGSVGQKQARQRRTSRWGTDRSAQRESGFHSLRARNRGGCLAEPGSGDMTRHAASFFVFHFSFGMREREIWIVDF